MTYLIQSQDKNFMNGPLKQLVCCYQRRYWLQFILSILCYGELFTISFNNKIMCRVGKLLKTINNLDQVYYLETLHNTGFVYGTLTLNNIVLCKQNQRITLSDFCDAQRYIKSGQHIKYTLRENDHFQTELTKFSGIDQHQGAHPSRKSDIESLFYIFLYLFNSSAYFDPKVKCLSQKQYFNYIYEQKLEFIPELNYTSCQIPESICELYNYIKYMSYEESPNYSQIIKSFEQGIQNYGSYKQEDLTNQYAWVDFLQGNEQKISLSQRSRRKLLQTSAMERFSLNSGQSIDSELFEYNFDNMSLQHSDSMLQTGSDNDDFHSLDFQDSISEKTDCQMDSNRVVNKQQLSRSQSMKSCKEKDLNEFYESFEKESVNSLHKFNPLEKQRKQLALENMKYEQELSKLKQLSMIEEMISIDKEEEKITSKSKSSSNDIIHKNKLYIIEEQKTVNNLDLEEEKKESSMYINSIFDIIQFEDEQISQENKQNITRFLETKFIEQLQQKFISQHLQV